jgi:hypothetical protein
MAAPSFSSSPMNEPPPQDQHHNLQHQLQQERHQSSPIIKDFLHKTKSPIFNFPISVQSHQFNRTLTLTMLQSPGFNTRRIIATQRFSTKIHKLKLRDRLDWLEAIKTGDPFPIRDAQLKITYVNGIEEGAALDFEGTRAESESNQNKGKEVYLLLNLSFLFFQLA